MATALPPLLRLPAELRNSIYEFTLSHDGPINVRWYPSSDSLSVADHPDKSVSVGLSLLKHSLHATCKTVCEESSGVFLPANDFRIIIQTISDGNDQHVLRVSQLFISAIGGLENAHSARSLTALITSATRSAAASATVSAIPHLHMWCTRPTNSLRLQLVVSPHLRTTLNMSDLRTSCTAIVREMEQLTVGGGKAFKWGGRRLEQACGRAELSRTVGRVVLEGEDVFVLAEDGVYDEMSG
ncbi:hypothetical protein LTR15_011303 [Elasticomyces elasticus]|nr:hypothetical protein LTR15_011303 [Elasticomyces elasticus]